MPPTMRNSPINLMITLLLLEKTSLKRLINYIMPHLYKGIYLNSLFLRPTDRDEVENCFENEELIHSLFR